MIVVTDNSSIILNPIGIVRSGVESPGEVPITGKPAEVEVFSQYSQALLRIEANSHLWLLLWFHQAERNKLTKVPARVNPFLPEYGVFGLRAPHRPNPIALSLVHLDSVEGNILKVSGLDAIDGTPVLDIKSYYEQDIVFSPKTPYISAFDPIMRRNIFFKEALAHHQEACPELYLAVRMAMVADEYMGHLNTPDLTLTVIGSACLADTLQGLSRARLANPPRFRYEKSKAVNQSIWQRSGQRLTLTARQKLNAESYQNLSDEDLFIIELTKHEEEGAEIDA
ncbi:tRNA (N6-threonylcarbamoyladenosine(37)-N6)-methyltransferase TrmO [Sporotomaculum syntrophicum]